MFGPAGTFNPSVVASRSHRHGLPRSIHPHRQLGESADCQPDAHIGIFARRHRSHSQALPTLAESSALSIFPSYITDSTIQMAINLVKYFNNLPIKLPAEMRLPTRRFSAARSRRSFIKVSSTRAQTSNQTIVGATNPSLQQLLLAIPLPTTPGSDLQIYIAAEMSAHRRITSGAHRRHHAGLQSQHGRQ